MLFFVVYNAGPINAIAAKKQRRITASAVPVNTCFMIFLCKERCITINRQSEPSSIVQVSE